MIASELDLSIDVGLVFCIDLLVCFSTAQRCVRVMSLSLLVNLLLLLPAIVEHLDHGERARHHQKQNHNDKDDQHQLYPVQTVIKIPTFFSFAVQEYVFARVRGPFRRECVNEKYCRPYSSCNYCAQVNLVDAFTNICVVWFDDYQRD